MKVAVTGQRPVGTALRRRLESAGHEVLAVVRRPVDGGEAAVRWNPAAGTLDAADPRGGRRGGQPGRRRHRRPALDRGAKARAAREPYPGHRAAGRGPGLARTEAVRADQRLGHRLLRRSRRRDPHRAERAGDDFLAGICVAWEAATSAARAAGIRVATIRTGIVLSPEGGALPACCPCSGGASAAASGRAGSGGAGSPSTTRSTPSSGSSTTTCPVPSTSRRPSRPPTPS